MPRKAFVADREKAKADPLPPNVSSLETGGEDGSFVFTHTPPGYDAIPVTVQALVSGA